MGRLFVSPIAPGEKAFTVRLHSGTVKLMEDPGDPDTKWGLGAAKKSGRRS
jgi:hypothetical protein